MESDFEFEFCGSNPAKVISEMSFLVSYQARSKFSGLEVYKPPIGESQTLAKRTRSRS